jgi:hypothetical protein
MFRIRNGNIESVDADYEAQAGETLCVDQDDPALVAALHAQANAPAVINSRLQAQMDALDGGGQARQIRGAVLSAGLPDSDELARLQALDAQVTALRAQLVH